MRIISDPTIVPSGEVYEALAQHGDEHTDTLLAMFAQEAFEAGRSFEQNNRPAVPSLIDVPAAPVAPALSAPAGDDARQPLPDGWLTPTEMEEQDKLPGDPIERFIYQHASEFEQSVFVAQLHAAIAHAVKTYR